MTCQLVIYIWNVLSPGAYDILHKTSSVNEIRCVQQEIHDVQNQYITCNTNVKHIRKTKIHDAQHKYTACKKQYIVFNKKYTMYNDVQTVVGAQFPGHSQWGSSARLTVDTFFIFVLVFLNLPRMFFIFVQEYLLYLSHSQWGLFARLTVDTFFYICLEFCVICLGGFFIYVSFTVRVVCKAHRWHFFIFV